MAPIVERVSESGVVSEGPHWDVETQSKPNQFVTAIDREFHLITWDGISDTVSNLQKIAEVDNQPGLEGNRINDGKADPTGRLWAGTTCLDIETCANIPYKGTLYSIDKSRQVKSHVSKISISNGLAWNADLKKFYYIDSVEKRVDEFDFDAESGAIKNRKPLFTLEKHNINGIPDGQAIDADGNLWVALFNSFRVIKIDTRNPETLLDTVELPVPQITSVAFGGANLNELYVTTANIPNLADGVLPPESGCVYRITGLGVKGVPGVRVKM
ncbi:hypothetical protein ILUMI_18682 [Ignelater luminosus]|uniref:SMP-30/Gluconolactonase/LRE-like region domain-containing protein n=1 Tax=Ignelater luminosus TaxID=2038154 RepID=A0A8K0G6B2_IGNLU|nr:hypothetical protein ILUMI_18682 [Ignelater luminosus]